ncbi:trypsin-like peptidase domain-containing protein [Winogradskyella immobilis]|uniref:Trypsin-like peptidase domain-containing protein n=1 Tax=Winogradskyella immobilis TaxID=2816852 RepID=A0ABS8ENI5_9FLAO|nr:trypsin-like peptidase domain-containing protein [Winogradskyella immobilis]MCC1484774.1 trypsin-like peptidase domain-containing protein [Winogradskyella immobilis]MCG0016866.1 trypsin-like peptidase domain-containing protein [Winogradskyella immobilis]
MKKILTLVGVSALGGLLTLGGYKLFIEEENKPIIEIAKPQLPNYVPTTYTNTVLTNTERPNLVEAANKTIDAVVHVKNTTTSRGYTSFEDIIRGRPSERKQDVGAGSGVIISPDGHIITNNHVIRGASEISITLNDNKAYTAELIGTDEKTDIALLKIDAEDNLPFITFGDSDTTQIGEWVLAVGNPFNLTSTVTAGIISAKARDLSGGQSFIQTDAAVNPGNSGGALVNTNGELVGINTAITSRTGTYVGYSFAVPSNIARKIVEDIMEFGDVQNGILGVVGGALNSEAAEQLKITATEGFYVSEVQEKSGADLAGILTGDIIKRLDNIKISKFSDLSGYLKTKNPNDVINVEVLRDDEIKVIPVTLSKSEVVIIDFMDMQLRNIPNEIKKEYNIESGVIVTETENAWLYRKLGMSSGYVITGINDKEIKSIDDISVLKNKYGSDFTKNLKKIEFINRNLEKKEVIFDR